MSDWGLSPQQLRDQLRSLEWENQTHRRARLLGQRPLPIRASLRAPTARQALNELDHLQSFVTHWQDWPGPGRVLRETKSFRRLGQQRIPVALELDTLDELFRFLGRDVQTQMQQLSDKMQALLAIDNSLYPALVAQLNDWDKLSLAQTQTLAQLLPQLHEGLGSGLYLRALPVVGVDTKFIEQHYRLIQSLLDHQNGDALTAAGGLNAWLGCLSKPSGWLQIRPLCGDARATLSGLALFQLDSDTLTRTPLPGRRLLVVENEQSGLALPEIADTVAVSGCGKNLSWLHAQWTANKTIGYWGDIDTHGLHCLDLALSARSHIEALMMDQHTFDTFEKSRSREARPYRAALPHLGAPQQALYQRLLREASGNNNRLEQERLHADTIARALQTWQH